MNKSIGFVILHYNAIEETKNCVNSIIDNIDTENYNIVIVDNNSPNHTGKELEKLYVGNEKITVIINEKNLGFACGNNIGYQYAVQVLHCDFVCVMNNDTLVIQDDFFSVIIEEYINSEFGVLGPRIILKDGSDNRICHKLPDIGFFMEELKILKKDYWQMRWRLNYIIVPCKLIRNYIFKLLGVTKVSRYLPYHLHDVADQRREDVVLHGCCLVFSPAFANVYKEAFNPNTFLYKEEELLYIRCRNKELKMVYNPKLRIKHLEDVATNSISVRKRKKLMFWLENQIASLQVLIDEMKREKE